MLCRVFAILPILGILYCPFACMGTGMVTRNVVDHTVAKCGCGCCEHETAQGDSLPANESPTAPDGGCHQCVCNVVVETSAKPLLADDEGLPANWALPSSQDRRPISAGHPVPQFMDAAPPDRSSGIAVRLRLGSLVI